MFVTNPCTHDARVMKEAKTLSDSGYEVRVFALANAYNEPGIFPQDGYIVQRLKFNNIFQRTRDFVWGGVSRILAPIRWFVRVINLGALKLKNAVTYGVGVIIVGFLLMLSKIFPDVFSAKDIRQLRSVGDDRRLAFRSRLSLRLRYIRIGIYYWLKTRFSFPLRLKTLNLLDHLGWALFRLARANIVLLLKFKFIYRKSKVAIKRQYRLARNFMIGEINRLIYKVMLPVHKMATYYYFCKNASHEAVKWRADIAHAHDLNTMYAAYLVKKKIKSKIVYDSHELWIHRNRVGRKARLEKFIDKIVEKWLIQYSDVVITVCDSIGDWLMARYSSIPEPVIVRNMPYRFTQQKDDVSLVPLKSRLNIPKNDLTMIYTGKLTSGRGLEIGMHALAEIDNLYMVLLGYGEPGYIDSIKSLARTLNVEKRMKFCDAVPHDEVTNFIYGADFALVYIEPICLSYEYALPNKLFESIQAGIPVFGSNLVEIEKLVVKENIGLCFDTPKDLANKIRLNTSAKQLAEWRDSIMTCQTELCWESEQKRLIESYSSLQL